MAKEYSLVTPKFVRRLELLEALCFSFIEHCNRPDLLEMMDRTLGDFFKQDNFGGVQ